MNKADLVEYVSKYTNTKKEAATAVDAVFDGISKALKKKDEVRIIGFGTFKVKSRKARMGRNPQTGAKIKIPARRVPAFAAGAELKNMVR
ncbi:MAG: HU family DNA-binding protein [Candidatus Diapherotrites archaeon]|nr:HU family DNA-binding protein [Candidatus Diapherotrites archaeon]